MDIITDEKGLNNLNRENMRSKKALAEKFLLEIARIAGVDAKSFELKGREYEYDIMLARLPLCICSVKFTDGDLKGYDGIGCRMKFAVASDNECDVHCGYFSSYGAMMGEDGSVTFRAKGDSNEFEKEVKSTVAELSSRVLYESDGIVAIVNKEASYGLVYVGKKEYRVEFFHDSKGHLCFQIRNKNILACHFGILSKLLMNKIIPAMEAE